MKLAVKPVLLAAALALCGCVSTLTLDTDEAITVVPYELQPSGRIVVRVRINDRGPFPFAIDTAASISFIVDDFRRQLGLETIPNVSTTIHGAVASGRFPMVRIDRLEVGTEAWTDAELVSLPRDSDATATIAGILGIDFLRRYGVGFSVRDRVVRLYPPELVRDRSYRGWASVPIEPVNIGDSRQPLYFFEIEIGGNVVPALFDLGAGLNMVNPSAARDLRLLPRRLRDETVLSGVLESTPILARLGAQELRTAEIAWRNEELLIADAEIFSTLMHADRPLAIVGAGLFNQRDFVIDFVRNRLLVRVAMNEVDESSE
jgi:hypothetical protein